MLICNCFQDQCSIHTSRFCNTIIDSDVRNYVCVLQSLCHIGVSSISNFVVNLSHFSPIYASDIAGRLEGG
jgi:hypothetical protein